jgi:hypothetical protein
MPNIYLPAESPEDWRKLLAEPTKQWKRGYSARALAYCWQTANGFPDEVKTLFAGSAYPWLAHLELLLAIPEHKTSLPGGRRASQTDLLVLAGGAGKLLVIGVEGKVTEPFGPTVTQWLSRPSAGKEARLAFLCHTLGLAIDQVSASRYQLLHRSVAAIREAQRFCAPAAMMLVHSFSQEGLWFEDYAAYLALFSLPAEVGAVTFAGKVSEVELYFGWVKGDRRLLTT